MQEPQCSVVAYDENGVCTLLDVDGRFRMPCEHGALIVVLSYTAPHYPVRPGSPEAPHT